MMVQQQEVQEELEAVLERHRGALETMESEAQQAEDLAATAERQLAELAQALDRPVSQLTRDRRKLEEEAADHRADAKLLRQRIRAYRDKHGVDALETESRDRSDQRAKAEMRARGVERMAVIEDEIHVRAEWMRGIFIACSATRAEIKRLTDEAEGLMTVNQVPMTPGIQLSLQRAEQAAIELIRKRPDIAAKYLPWIDDARAWTSAVSKNFEEANQ